MKRAAHGTLYSLLLSLKRSTSRQKRKVLRQQHWYERLLNTTLLATQLSLGGLSLPMQVEMSF